MSTRARSLTLALMLPLAAACAPEDDSALNAVAEPADRVYTHANAITLDDTRPRAEAIAVRDGDILAVGSAEEIAAYIGDTTQVEDLAGATVVPGFIDAHGHLAFAGLNFQGANLLPPPDGGVSSIADLQQALRDWMAESDFDERKGLIYGFGYDDSLLAEQRHPTREELDAVSTDLPVLVLHQSGHLSTANSLALERLGFSAETPNPPGGVIRRRPESNEPNGVLEETANMMAMRGLVLSSFGADDALAAVRAGQALYARMGFTTAQDGGTTPELAAGYVAAAERGELVLDVISYMLAPTLREENAFMTGPYVGRSYRNGYRIGGIKLMLDGSPQGKTAWLTKPYHQPPPGQDADYRGYPIETDEQVAADLKMAFERGWQVLAHTNGDAAIDQYLNAMAGVLETHPVEDHRSVAIHAQTTRADQLDRMRALGIIPSFFAAHTFYWGDWHRDSVLGPERAANISPTGWAVERGMRFTTHHDAPVIPPNGLRILWATASRTTRSGQVLGAHQRVPVEVALRAMTLWAAWQSFEEDRKGSIEPGKLADLTVLSADPLAVALEEIPEISVLRTIKAGEEIYSRD